MIIFHFALCCLQKLTNCISDAFGKISVLSKNNFVTVPLHLQERRNEVMHTSKSCPFFLKLRKDSGIREFS